MVLWRCADPFNGPKYTDKEIIETKGPLPPSRSFSSRLKIIKETNLIQLKSLFETCSKITHALKFPIPLARKFLNTKLVFVSNCF